MDKLRAMQAFVRIVDEGSLTAAANALGTSLPSVVRTLAELEASVGCRLLNRTTRRQALTEEGRHYLERSRRVLADIDDLEASLADQAIEPRGRLNITAPVLLGQMLVAPATRRFVQRHDKVQCNLMLTDQIVNLVEDQIDVGVRIDHLQDSTLVSQAIGTVRRVVVASPAYVAQHGAPRHPKDLLQADCVSAGRPWLFREGAHEFKLTVQGKLSFNVGPPAIEACVEGAGFGMFLSYQVAPFLATRQLCVVLEPFERAPMPVNIVYPQARLLPWRTRLFIDWIRADVGGALRSREPPQLR